MQQQAEISETQEKLRQADIDRAQLEGEVLQLKEAINIKKADAEREHRKRERLEKEVRELKGTLEQKSSELKQKQLQIGSADEQQTKLNIMLSTAKASTEKMQKEYNQLNDRVTKLHADLEEQIHQNTELLADNCQKQVSLKLKDEEIESTKAEVVRVTKLRDQTHKKIKGLEEQRHEIEKERDTLKAGTACLCVVVHVRGTRPSPSESRWRLACMHVHSDMRYLAPTSAILQAVMYTRYMHNMCV
jgi:chromosome segregation ATPase